MHEIPLHGSSYIQHNDYTRSESTLKKLQCKKVMEYYQKKSFEIKLAFPRGFLAGCSKITSFRFIIYHLLLVTSQLRLRRATSLFPSVSRTIWSNNTFAPQNYFLLNRRKEKVDLYNFILHWQCKIM